jgi:hypothetical protein
MSNKKHSSSVGQSVKNSKQEKMYHMSLLKEELKKGLFEGRESEKRIIPLPGIVKLMADLITINQEVEELFYVIILCENSSGQTLASFILDDRGLNTYISAHYDFSGDEYKNDWCYEGIPDMEFVMGIQENYDNWAFVNLM